MEDIRNPSRIHTLDSRTIPIIQHISNTNLEVLNLENVFPFETLFTLKQRIAIAHSSEKDRKHWLPNQYFLAVESEKPGHYIPLEFQWDFANTLQDPFHPTVLGKPNKHIFQNGERVPITPTILSGITIETALPSFPKKQQAIHIWTISSLATATGFSPTSEISDEIFFGFLQLYFPTIQAKESLVYTFEELTEQDKEAFDVLHTHRQYVSSRMNKLDTLLQSPEMKAVSPPFLSELLDLHYSLPKKSILSKGSLELQFHGMKPSEAIPFLRFFPANTREMPVTKIHTIAKGVSAIENKKLLMKLLDDQPSSELGAVILMKAPVQHAEAPFGTTWTIRIYEDGSAELIIGAPKKNQPLTGQVLAEAFRMLPILFQHTPWLTASEMKLSNISALYKFRSSLSEKPSKEELKKRLDPFLPLFVEEKGLDPTSQMSLRYKAVSNYVRDTDPIMDYIATLYLRDSILSTDRKVFPEYVKELVIEFGITQKEAQTAIDTWVEYHSEQVIAEKGKVLYERNIGCAISIYNDHPNYRFLLTNVESITDIQRILTFLVIFTSNTSEILRVAESVRKEKEVMEVLKEVEEEVAKNRLENTEEGEEENDAWSFTMAAKLPQANDEEEEEEDEEENEESKENKQSKEIEKEIEKEPKKLETLPSLGDEWFLDKLKEKNSGLFSYTDAPKPYSRVCQASTGKQPNVMDFASYKRARNFYKTDVFWKEAPLTSDELFILHFVSKSLNERRKLGKDNKLDEKAMIEKEKQGLRMGFPLKDNKSIVTIETDKKKHNPLDKQEIEELIKAQQNKPLWTVIRAGSDNEKPNYYICAELWCIKDNLPLIVSEFQGSESRQLSADGKRLKKEENTCPICEGRIIQNPLKPNPGETVLQRKKIQPSKIQKYIGFTKVIHPKGYALPCCFAEPNNLDVPDDTKPLPTHISVNENTQPPVKQVENEVRPMRLQPASDKENRARPFSPYKKGSSTKNEWYIPNQNILGRIIDRWSFVERGNVSVPSKAVNALLGQNPEKFLTEKGGVLQGSINSQLKINAHAFVQYGLGNSQRQPGANLISFLAYANYATSFTQNPDHNLAIPSNEAVISAMLEEKQIEMFHAFQTANYGTLVHEFSVPEQNFDTVTEEGAFQAWYSSVAGNARATQRAYFKNLYLAWNNFKNYIHDKDQPKDLRLWESLFAQPGLLTKTGFLLVKIKVPKNPADEATIECPEFGISYRHQQVKPPLLFILQDTITGLYDPLVLYDGISKDERNLLGVIQENMPIFGSLSPNVREALYGFLQQYYKPVEGCARTAEPIHPWIPVRETTRVPRLGDLYDRMTSLNLVLQALLRDRSNRLVGIIIRNKLQKDAQVPFFIPCMDDGTLLPGIPSIYGEEDIPRPPLKDLLEVLTGKQIKISEKKLSSEGNFPGLLPKRILSDKKYMFALDLACGATIPFSPIPLSIKLEKADIHRRFSDLPKVDLKDDLPWETDIALLGPTAEDTETLGQTDEEGLNESYQHLRIAISNWLNDSVRGQKIRKQIELLRQARKRLPLYELQKRLDILLTPIVRDFMKEGTQTKSFLLRRDCLQIKTEGSCIGGCTWSDGRCLIHTTRTPRYVDPLRVLTARLVDELLRTFGLAMEILNQRVSYLNPIAKGEILEEENSILFSAFGKGNDALYDKLGYSRRRPGVYTQGLTFPEEVGIHMEKKTIPEEWGLRKPSLSSEALRDLRTTVITILIDITGKNLTEIEAVTDTFIGSRENWEAFANWLHINIIFTKLQGYILTYEDTIVCDPGSDNYMVLDADRIPLMQKRTNKYILGSKDLPKELLPFMKENKPTLSFKLKECNTIVKLNDRIGEHFQEELGSEVLRTIPTGTLSAFGFANLQTMFSSAGSYDCLIHSFLTSVSENFRRLTQPNKDEFASYFRRTIYPEILDALHVKPEQKAEILQRVLPIAYLLDQDIVKLCEMYKINMVMFENEKIEKILGEEVHMPRCVSYFDEKPASNESYMLYNNANHYEAVKGESYIISSRLAKEIHEQNPCGGKATQSVQCLFDEGDTLLYKGKIHYVIWRLSSSDGNCEQYGLTRSEKSRAEFMALPRKEKDKKTVMKRYGTIKANPMDVSSPV